ncbi:hypothetical protein SAMN04515671_4298 [Nakamurella panacisegetis]|uniref:Uncharacterized protein n=1 Tax=Nakamurella panacisegetis TaxID=1090615 RepID=A0A1H0SU91_9ACTN|nr:hypothetical protein [Nakamurella panacisegetis]SDP45357.1 hypothetical protein SAMN04515671_4298 [Nakamurella panacisegetis]
MASATDKLTRREAAIRLDIPPEMAVRNGLPARISEAALARLDADPPPWLAQSRANRTGRKPVWTQLTCDLCGRTETVRPKKWWPDFTFVRCDDHRPDALPAVADGFVRAEYPGIGTRFVGVLDEALADPPAPDDSLGDR